jgi:hypothetical protein
VFLYISSHGTPEGLSVGGKTIGAAAIADALEDAWDLRLLHFGSCSMLNGPLPQKIFDRLGAHATFPVSGYRNPADWAGSAVIDFLYLSLVLEHRMPPAQAVDYVRSAVSFSQDSTTRPGPIAPAGLSVVSPPHVSGTSPATRPRTL